MRMEFNETWMKLKAVAHRHFRDGLTMIKRWRDVRYATRIFIFLFRRDINRGFIYGLHCEMQILWHCKICWINIEYKHPIMIANFRSRNFFIDKPSSSAVIHPVVWKVKVVPFMNCSTSAELLSIRYCFIFVQKKASEASISEHKFELFIHHKLRWNNVLSRRKLF